MVNRNCNYIIIYHIPCSLFVNLYKILQKAFNVYFINVILVKKCYKVVKIMKRTVSFYYINLEKRELVEKENHERVTKKTNINNNEFFSIFINVYENMKSLSNGNRVQAVITSVDKLTNVEIYKFDRESKLVYAKIGQESDKNTVEIRNRATNESSDLSINDNEMVEIYTYCLIDFNTGIISYIGIGGAPKVKAISLLFKHYFDKHNLNYLLNISAVLTKDIVSVLSQKRFATKMYFTVAVPPDNILEQIVTNRDDFDDLENVHSVSITYAIKARRNKNLFKDASDIENIVNNVKDKFGADLKKFSMDARNAKESSQNYDLLEDKFTAKAELDSDGVEHHALTTDTFSEALIKTYNQNRAILLEYIKTDSDR